MNEYKSKGFMFFKLDNNYELVYQIITIDDMVKTVSPVFQEAIADILYIQLMICYQAKNFLIMFVMDVLLIMMVFYLVFILMDFVQILV